MNPAYSDKPYQIDIDTISSSVYMGMANYSNAVTPDKVLVAVEHDSQLFLLLDIADKLGRQVSTKNFEKSASPRPLFKHLDYQRLIKKLVQVINVINGYSRKNFGHKWSILINPKLGSIYASAVIRVVREHVCSLKSVEIIHSPHVIFMGVKGGIVQRIKGTDVLLKVLSDINMMLRQDAGVAANNFDHNIKRIYKRNVKSLKALVITHERLNFVRIFLPMVDSAVEDKKLLAEGLKQKITKFTNSIRRKTTIFGECVWHRKGEIIDWGSLTGSEFIFFFKSGQSDFDFYTKQSEVLEYWFDYLKLGSERNNPKYLLQPHYARNYDVRTALDHRKMSELSEFMIRNVLPVRLAHIFIRNDSLVSNFQGKTTDVEQNTGGSDAQQQVAY